MRRSSRSSRPSRSSSSSSASTGTSSRRRSGSGSRCRRSSRSCSRWCRSPPSTSFSSAEREDGRGALGQDPGDLAVRADLHRGHLHLAHGAHGLRSLRAPPALACLRHHSGQLARRVHAHPWLRDEGRLGDRAPVLPPDRLRVLDHEPARPARFRRRGPRLAVAQGSGEVSPELASGHSGERRRTS